MAKREKVTLMLKQIVADSSPGMRLPPERELSERFGVARETLRRCLIELDEEGVIERRPGAGNFVAMRREKKEIALRSFSEEMRARGLEPSSALLSADRIAAGPKIGQYLRVSPASYVYKIVRVRHANQVPMALETVYLPAERLPGFDPEELSEKSLYNILEERYQFVLSQAQQQIEATVLEQAEAELLGVAPFSAALLVERRMSTAQELPIEFCKTLYRADRYKFEVDIRRALI
ncbi:GntR family transcriptional regulator [Parasalinivibrio latis]|uniref:GntR family transcriptional regulator n=1 Tax=Parasalinivibrio latis TaxID=2952610 RepID=UPI0030E3D284